MSLKKIWTILGIASWVGLFSACDMLEGVYDDTADGGDNSGTENGSSQQNDSVMTNDSTVVSIKSGQYYINATSYTQWVYINLHGDSLVITTSTINLKDSTESGTPQEWDFAQHRYDVKTNGASVMMTNYHSIEELETAGLPAEPLWVEDEWSDASITIDMSHMMEGYLTYAPGYKNKEAGKWLNVDLSTMPPIYTMYDNVMLYRFSDSTYAAVQLVDFMSNDRYQTKGWMTVNYKYPIFAEAKN